MAGLCLFTALFFYVFLSYIHNMENLFEKYAGLNQFVPKANTFKEALKTIPRDVKIPKLPSPAANPVNAASRPVRQTNVLATGLGKPKVPPPMVKPAMNGTVI
jgi:hypothetical protein